MAGLSPPRADPRSHARQAYRNQPRPVNGRQRAPVDMLMIALGAAILCYVWRVQDLFPILATIRAPVLSSLAMVGCYAIEKDRRRALSTAWHPITRYVLLIFGLAVLSVPTSVYRGMSVSFLLNDFGKNVLLFGILAASLRSFHDVRRMAAVLVIGGAIYAQFVYFRVPIHANGRLGRIAYYDANDIGMFLACTMPLGLFFLLRGRNLIVKAGAAIAIAFFSLVIVKTGSRGAFLTIIGLGLYLLFFLGSVPVRWRVSAVAASVALVMTVGGEQYWGLMRTMLNPQDDYNWSGNSDSGRMDVWKRGVGYMIDRPITGVGVRAFGTAEGTISPIAGRQAYGIGVKWSTAHNSFVEIGAELGLGGLLVFVLLLRAGYRTARRAHTRAGPLGPATDNEVLGQALGGTIVAYIVGGFFLSQAYSAYLMVLCALIVGLNKTAPRAELAGSTSLAHQHRKMLVSN